MSQNKTNKVEKRIIQPYMDLEDIIEDEIMAYLQFIVDQRQGALSQLVINVVEKFLLRIAKNKENYPSENEMESIINQIGNVLPVKKFLEILMKLLNNKQ